MEILEFNKELCGEEFETIDDLINSYNTRFPSFKCNYSDNGSGILIRCLTCSRIDNSTLCLNCFFNGDHKNHDYIIETGTIGFCDCGDPLSFDPKGFCPDHKPPVENPELLLSQEERERFMAVFDKAGKLLVSKSQETIGATDLSGGVNIFDEQIEDKASFFDIVRWLSKFSNSGAPVMRCMIISVMKYLSIDFQSKLQREYNDELVEFEKLIINDEYVMKFVWPRYFKELPESIEKLIGTDNVSPIKDICFYITSETSAKILSKKGEFVETMKRFLFAISKYIREAQNCLVFYISGIYEIFINILTISFNKVIDQQDLSDLADVYGDFLLTFEDIFQTERTFGDKRDDDEICFYLLLPSLFLHWNRIYPEYATTHPIKILLTYLKEKNAKPTCPAKENAKISLTNPLHSYVALILQKKGIEILNNAAKELGMDSVEAAKLLMRVPMESIAASFYAKKNYFVRNTDDEISVISGNIKKDDSLKNYFNLLQLTSSVVGVEAFSEVLKTCFEVDYDEMLSSIFILVSNLIFDRSSISNEENKYIRQIIYLLTSYKVLQFSDFEHFIERYIVEDDTYRKVRGLVTLEDGKYVKVKESTGLSCFTSINNTSIQCDFIDGFIERNKTSLITIEKVEEVKDVDLTSFLHSDFFHELIDYAIRSNYNVNVRLALSILAYEQKYYSNEYNVEEFLKHSNEDKESLFDVILKIPSLGENALKMMNIGYIQNTVSSADEKKRLAKKAREDCLKRIKMQEMSFMDNASNFINEESQDIQLCPICQDELNGLIGYPFTIHYGPFLSKDDQLKLRFISCMHECHIKCFIEDGSNICPLDRQRSNYILPKITSFDGDEQLTDYIKTLFKEFTPEEFVVGFFNEIDALELRQRSNSNCITTVKINMIIALYRLIKYIFIHNLVTKESVLKELSPVFVSLLPLVLGEKSSEETLKENIESQENRLLFCRYLALIKLIIGEFKESDINEMLSTDKLEKFFGVDFMGHTLSPYKLSEDIPDDFLEFGKKYSFSSSIYITLNHSNDNKGAYPLISLNMNNLSQTFIIYGRRMAESQPIYVNEFGDPDPGIKHGLPLHLDKEKLEKFTDDFLSCEYFRGI